MKISWISHTIIYPFCCLASSADNQMQLLIRIIANSPKNINSLVKSPCSFSVPIHNNSSSSSRVHTLIVSSWFCGNRQLCVRLLIQLTSSTLARVKYQSAMDCSVRSIQFTRGCQEPIHKRRPLFLTKRTFVGGEKGFQGKAPTNHRRGTGSGLVLEQQRSSVAGNKYKNYRVHDNNNDCVSYRF